MPLRVNEPGPLALGTSMTIPDPALIACALRSSQPRAEPKVEVSRSTVSATIADGAPVVRQVPPEHDPVASASTSESVAIAAAGGPLASQSHPSGLTSLPFTVPLPDARVASRADMAPGMRRFG